MLAGTYVETDGLQQVICQYEVALHALMRQANNLHVVLLNANIGLLQFKIFIMRNFSQADDRVHRKLQDGIVYLFQYGYISEDKHFKMLDELNSGKDLMNSGRKF